MKHSFDNAKKQPNIKDVAQFAGVSTATVSRVLNDAGNVSEAARGAVLNAVEETGYLVNHAARNLRRRKTGAIVVLVPNLGNPFFSQILSGIERQAARAGFSVLVTDTKQPVGNDARVFEYLHNNRTDGLVILDGSLPYKFLKDSEKTNARSPIVFACEWVKGIAVPTITIDNQKGAALAVRHLFELGHRKIGHITGPPGNVLTAARSKGARRELKRLGLRVVPDWFFKGDFRLESGVEAARRWLDLEDQPTAVFCASDQMAFGFISELHQKNVGVPRDVSVIGFDDIEIAESFIPPLTTVHQPRVEIGATAADTLLECMAAAPDCTSVAGGTLPVELIVRASTCPPR